MLGFLHPGIRGILEKDDPLHGHTFEGMHFWCGPDNDLIRIIIIRLATICIIVILIMMTILIILINIIT